MKYLIASLADLFTLVVFYITINNRFGINLNPLNSIGEFLFTGIISMIIYNLYLAGINYCVKNNQA